MGRGRYRNYHKHLFLTDLAISKIVHMEGRRYMACMTPSQFESIEKMGADFRKSDAEYAIKKKEMGLSAPFWLFFDIRQESNLDKILIKRLGIS